MRSIEATGKSVDAAIFNGLQQLGISIDEVNIEIVQRETKGILGIGAKPAKVRLTEKPPEEVTVPDFEAERERDRERRERNDRRRERGQGFGDDRKGRNERGDRNEGRGRRGREEGSERESAASAVSGNAAQNARQGASEAEKTAPALANDEAGADDKNAAPDDAGRSRPGKAETRFENKPANREERKADFVRIIDENIKYTEEDAVNNPAADFVKGLIEHMGIEGKVLAAKQEDAVRIRIDSEVMGVLIGHRGETLDAIQYLTSLVINRNRKTEGYTRVTVNTEDYREKREETLIRLARRVASQVKATGRARVLEPMNPYERRILHSALQNNPNVMTHSEGEEPNRRVVVTPRRRGGRRGNEAN